MAETGWLVRRRLRRRWLALVPLVLIVGLGGAAAFVSLGAAERTSNTYSRYLERGDVGDVLLNPSLFTADIDDVIRTLPGVRSVTSDALFLTIFDDDGAPRSVAELAAVLDAPTGNGPSALQVRGSADGRHTTMDLPALSAGRMPEGPAEALVSNELAAARGVAVGDIVPVSFWDRADDPGFDALPEGEGLDATTVVSPVGVEHIEVVGIGTLSDEVLPDGLYPRQRMIVSPDVVAPYDCLPDAPPPGASLEEGLAILSPGGCAAAYRYYSLDVEGGDAGLAAVQDTFLSKAVQLSRDLPEEIQAELGGVEMIVTTTAQERERVERSVQPTVAALVALGVAAVVATAAVAGLATARELRRTQDDQKQWWHLGMTTVERSSVAMAPLLAAVGTGVAGALALAWWLSPVGPVGTVRSVDPVPRRELASAVWLGALALTAVLVAAIVLLAVRTARRSGREPGRGRDVPTMRRLVRGSTRPEVAEGIRAAYGGRGSGLVIASGAVGATVFLTAVVFANSLSTLVSTPRSYGWPWDIAVMGGYGYGGMDLDAIAATLDEHDDVEGWTGLGFVSSVTLDGEPELSVIGSDHHSAMDLTVVEGRLPTGGREVALGARTAADRGIGVGDEVALAGDQIKASVATVTGRVVLPALGPFQADRTAPGTGLLLPSAMLDERFVPLFLSFVGIGLTPGADPEAVRGDLEGDFAAWDTYFGYPLAYTEPVRPAEIVDARSMRTLPLAVGGLLALAASIGLAFSVVVSVRSRRRELATVRALGFTGRQIRDSIRVQTVATMIAALVVGAPIGIAVGRVAWRAFASQLGVVTDPTVPGLWILAIAAGAVVVALAAAAVPARQAARAEPAVVLRSE